MLPRHMAEITPLPAKTEIAVCSHMGFADELCERGFQFGYRPISHFKILWFAKSSSHLLLDAAEAPFGGHLYLGYTAWYEHAANLSKRPSNIRFGEMLQHAIRIDEPELLIMERWKSSIGDEVS